MGARVRAGAAGYAAARRARRHHHACLRASYRPIHHSRYRRARQPFPTRIAGYGRIEQGVLLPHWLSWRRRMKRYDFLTLYACSAGGNDVSSSTAFLFSYVAFVADALALCPLRQHLYLLCDMSCLASPPGFMGRAANPTLRLCVHNYPRSPARCDMIAHTRVTLLAGAVPPSFLARTSWRLANNSRTLAWHGLLVLHAITLNRLPFYYASLLHGAFCARRFTCWHSPFDRRLTYSP